MPYAQSLSFFINTQEKSTAIRKIGGLEMSALAFGFKTVQSSFAQAINKQEKRTGSLFRQKTKAKVLDDDNGQTVLNRQTVSDYPTTPFHYIHQNPLKAGLVKKMEDWPYSSFSDYAKLKNGTLCNTELACPFLNLNPDTFMEDSYLVVDDKMISDLY